MTKPLHADGYSEAIPIDELVALARADIDSCSAKPDEAIRECAERLVRSKLCPCASSVEFIVDAIVSEYRRQLGDSSAPQRSARESRGN